MAEDDQVPGLSKPKVGSPHERSPFKEKPISDAEFTHLVQASQDEISLLDILIVLAKHKKLVVGLPFLAAVITAGVALLMPNWYTATARILPPQQSQSNAVAILGQLGALSGGAGQSLGLKNPSDIFVAMLKSRTVADNLILKYNLPKVYDEELPTDIRKELKNNTNILVGRDGVIVIEVEDKNPLLARDVANGYVGELELLTRRLAITEAGQRRLFFEQQLKQAKEDLTQAETELAKFQIEKKVLNPQGQASLTISAAAGLQAQIAAKEVQIASLRSFATQENPDLNRAQEELGGLRAQLAKTSRGGSGDIGDVTLSIGKAPQEGVEYLRKFRDVKYYETLFELLAKQYEIAKIDEAKNATLIQVLDNAIKPDKKSGPKRTLIVLFVGFASVLVAIVSALVRESSNRAINNPNTSNKVRALRALLRVSLLKR
jgi:tyrosine-protein kinase Etk/Wzc